MTAERTPGTSRAGGSPLHILAALFVMAAVVRGLAVADAARAAGAALEPAPTAAEATCAPNDNPAFYAALIERQKLLEAREAKAAATAKELVTTRAEIATQLSELTAAEQRLSRAVDVAAEGSEGDVSRLVAVYESMKPKEAVPLFDVMDPDFAAGFLARMRPEASAAILAGLPPEKAYTISAVMAGRNAKDPPAMPPEQR